jgi:hypothetical protein
VTGTNFAAVARALQARALRLARARFAARRTDPARRWRKPALLWPLFAKG